MKQLVGPFVCCDHHTDAVESECQRRMAERKNLILSDQNWELQNRINLLEEKVKDLEEEAEDMRFEMALEQWYE